MEIAMIQANVVEDIVIKPDPGIDPVKELGPGFYGKTWVNPGKPIKPGLFRGQIGLKIRNEKGRH
jgi:hypothetical protein